MKSLGIDHIGQIFENDERQKNLASLSRSTAPTFFIGEKVKNLPTAQNEFELGLSSENENSRELSKQSD